VGDIIKAGSFGQLASDSSIEVFICCSLERRISVGEIGRNPDADANRKWGRFYQLKTGSLF
jgi:hypothetical protein